VQVFSIGVGRSPIASKVAQTAQTSTKPDHAPKVSISEGVHRTENPLSRLLNSKVRRQQKFRAMMGQTAAQAKNILTNWSPKGRI